MLRSSILGWVLSLMLIGCGSEDELTLDETAEDAEDLQAGGYSCARLCNFSRLGGESRCDSVYDPDTQPALNSGCITLVFEQYTNCLDGCGVSPQVPPSQN